ncbi:hypothetical protein PHYBOEH_005412 [Phytophthora boehmeriae]|uniref:RxLR effector protein n=1 Tax=Phytophthora boehmeriae TaxID=109152 RepID=A0A8T1WLS8_9STRA|nr:hypothetical protein PHYBOEH_005412 [Phytophthora boehmeriae]
MRLSHVLVVIAAAFLVTSEALSTITDSNQIKLSGVEVTSQQSQRVLRTHHTIDEDDEEDEDDEDEDEEDDEERALTTTKMWRMKNKGMSAMDYAKKMNIDQTMLEIGRTGRGWAAFQHTKKFKKYVTYFNFLKENK